MNISDIAGFGFLPASMQPAPDARRGYVVGAPVPDVTVGTSVAGAAASVDTTLQHGVDTGTNLFRPNV